MHIRTTILAGLAAFVHPALGQQAVVPAPAEQIAAAILPLPPSLQAGAGVRGYSPAMKLIVLREGTNTMMCTADRPGDDQFDVRCYDRGFMAVIDWRNSLRQAGVDSATIERRYAAGGRSGVPRVPDHPTAGYRMLGPIAAFDAVTHVAGPAIEKWQSIHFPYRTAAEIGLPIDETPGMPYVMASGSWWAHVMIEHR